MTFDRDMMDALAADAEKLAQLTGEDHTPLFLADCEACGGEGAIEVPEIVSKWSIDPPGSHAVPCDACGGVGFFVCEAEGDPRVAEDHCPGHVASDAEPKVCRRCGVHIESLRPPEDE